jgi:hypothetical protein
MKTGRYNVGVGPLVMAGFMFYGFLLIYHDRAIESTLNRRLARRDR